MYVSDLHQLLANLRMKGISESVIRTVMGAAIDERFRAQENALLPRPVNDPWWQSHFGTMGVEAARELLALRREKSQLREDLLGPDPEAEVWENEQGIPPEKRMQAASITADYDAVIKLLRPTADRLLTAEEKDLVEALRQEAAAELMHLLDPMELAAFQEKSSEYTHRLQQELGGFAASDAEKSALSKYAGQSADSNGREDLQRAANEELQSALGEARYREFDFNRRLQFRNLADVVQRAGLPPERGMAVYDIWRRVDAESQRIRDNPNGGMEQQLSEMKSLAINARSQIQASLGPEVASAYLAHAESWLSKVEAGNVVSSSSPNSLSSMPVWFPRTR
jgi:hypothetical protein